MILKILRYFFCHTINEYGRIKLAVKHFCGALKAYYFKSHSFFHTSQDKFNNIKILIFAKGNFKPSQEKLNQHLISIGITNIVNLTEKDLQKSFLIEFQELLKEKRGYGYWIWKAFLILKELKNLKDDEILIYIDSTDLPEKLFFDIVIERFKYNDILLVNRGYNHGEWTKRDCFVLMNCDTAEYYNHVQLEAGILGLKKTEFNINLITKWFEYCKNVNILTDIPNVCGLPNQPNFKDHRNDQSILTNLSIKYGLESFQYPPNVIKYNYNQPKFYG